MIEAMVTVAIVGILAAIALPMFTDYSDTACQSIMGQNIDTIRLAQEEWRLTEGSYLPASGSLVYDPTDPDRAGDMFDELGWAPSKDASDPNWVDEDNITYTISNVTATGFRVVATSDKCDTVTRNCTTTGGCTPG